MLNERKLTEDEKAKRDAIVKAMIGSNKRGLVQRYGKNAEKIAYDRANKIVAQQSESMNTKLKELVRKTLANEAEFSKKHDDNPALKGKQKDLPDNLQKAIIDKSGNLDEGFLDRVKAKVKGAGAYIGTGVSNIGKAFTGKELKDPKLAAGMAKLGQKAKTLEKGLNDVINDVNILFPQTKLKEIPELGKIITYYSSLLNQAKKINAEVAKGDLSSLTKVSNAAPSTSSTPATPPTSTTTAKPTSTTTAKPKTTKSTKAPELKTKSGSYVKDGVAYNKDNKKLTGNVAKQVIAAIDKMKKSVAEYIIASKYEIVNEDLDLGHEDDEPHMIKGELYQIGKHAMIMYHLVDQFEGKGEVDFPAWWQSKITSAKTMLSGAKNYLEFELNEPQVDNVVNSFFDDEESFDDDEDMMGEGEMTSSQIKKRGEMYDALVDKGMDSETAGRIATSKAMGMNESSNKITKTDKLAAKIAKALKDSKNKSSEDQNNIKQARKAMNSGNIGAAEKIIKPYTEK